MGCGNSKQIHINDKNELLTLAIKILEIVIFNAYDYTTKRYFVFPDININSTYFTTLKINFESINSSTYADADKLYNETYDTLSTIIENISSKQAKSGTKMDLTTRMDNIEFVLNTVSNVPDLLKNIRPSININNNQRRDLNSMSNSLFKKDLDELNRLDMFTLLMHIIKLLQQRGGGEFCLQRDTTVIIHIDNINKSYNVSSNYILAVYKDTFLTEDTNKTKVTVNNEKFWVDPEIIAHIQNNFDQVSSGGKRKTSKIVYAPTIERITLPGSTLSSKGRIRVVYERNKVKYVKCAKAESGYVTLKSAFAKQAKQAKQANKPKPKPKTKKHKDYSQGKSKMKHG